MFSFLLSTWLALQPGALDTTGQPGRWRWCLRARAVAQEAAPVEQIQVRAQRLAPLKASAKQRVKLQVEKVAPSGPPRQCEARATACLTSSGFNSTASKSKPRCVEPKSCEGRALELRGPLPRRKALSIRSTEPFAT